MFQLAEHSSRDALLAERSDSTNRTSCLIYHIAKVDPHGGHLRLELVSPVPPSAQDISMRSERRSLSFPVPGAPRKGAFNKLSKGEAFFPS